MAFVRHGVLSAGVEATVALGPRKVDSVEVLNRDGSDEIFFKVVSSRRAGTTTATVDGDDCEVLPAAMCALELPAPEDPVVKLISNGSPAYSIRAE